MLLKRWTLHVLQLVIKIWPISSKFSKPLRTKIKGYGHFSASIFSQHNKWKRGQIKLKSSFSSVITIIKTQNLISNILANYYVFHVQIHSTYEYQTAGWLLQVLACRVMYTEMPIMCLSSFASVLTNKLIYVLTGIVLNHAGQLLAFLQTADVVFLYLFVNFCFVLHYFVCAFFYHIIMCKLLLIPYFNSA